MKTLLIHVCSNFINDEDMPRATTFKCDLIDTGRTNIADSVNNAYILFDGDMQADALKETMENKATTVMVTPHLRSAAYDYAKAIGVKLD